MKIIKSVRSMRRESRRLRQQGRSIGLVPTMGCLHEGHLSLVRRSVRENDITVVSIFVNPAQFGPKEDFNKYPRAFAEDSRICRSAGADIIFCPAASDMYPAPYNTYVEAESLTKGLCGRSRPGHFRGVATVVAKLFNIVGPDTAYFGQKDAQQAAVIKKMAADLNMGLKITVMPTVREKDGLAMSSRNTYLSPGERKDAVVLYKSLLLARTLVKKGEKSPRKIISAMKGIIKKSGPSKIDYIEVVDAATLAPVKKISGDVLIALAVYIGKTRLIDNIRMG